MFISICSIVDVERTGATSALLYSKNTLYVSLHFCLYILNNGRKGAINLVFRCNECFSFAEDLTLDFSH